MSFDTRFNRTAKTLAPGFARFMARCPKKGCKCVKTHDVPVKMEERRKYLPMGYPADQRAVYDGRYSVPVPDRASLPFATCPQHGHSMAWLAIEGTVSDARACDARCMSAIGPMCVCACGGANHGGAWL